MTSKCEVCRQELRVDDEKGVAFCDNIRCPNGPKPVEVDDE